MKPEREQAHAELMRTISGFLDQDPHSVPCVQEGWEKWTSDSRADTERARKQCRTCPALTQCRDYGDTYEQAGVWGAKRKGYPPSERKKL